MSRITYSSTFNDWLNEYGEVFKVIGDHDSGNMSYGIRTSEDEKYFVKYAPFKNKEALKFLENAYILGKNISHAILIVLKFAVECNDGLALVYDWVEGETINEVTNSNKSYIKELRQRPTSPYSRFRSLPVEKIINILNQIFDLHMLLEDNGYISCDWYDGCIMYDFEKDILRIMDLDVYNKGTFENTMGRMYGSSRFMAPEEFVLGETIDFYTSVYHMGATVFEFLGTGKKEPQAGFRGNKELLKVALKAIEPDKKDRYPSVKEFCEDWFGVLKSSEYHQSRSSRKDEWNKIRNISC